MYEEKSRMRETLSRIAELAESELRSGGEAGGSSNGGSGGVDYAELGCTPKSLPKRLLIEAAQTAREINPANSPFFGPVAVAGMSFDLSDPMRIAVLTSKFWGSGARQLSVSFMESTPSDLRRRILEHLNAWNRTVAIRFVETSGQGEVRISRGAGGFWSFVGTDILKIPVDKPTMNLQGFTMSTPDSEYRRVVRHEAGHTLGCPHEHMRRDLVARIDREKAFKFFFNTQGWDRKMVEAQVLTPLEEKSIMASKADQTSIMCYQLPGSITIDGQPIKGGTDINENDFAFMGQLYPLPQKHTGSHECTCQPAGQHESAGHDRVAGYDRAPAYAASAADDEWAGYSAADV